MKMTMVRSILFLCLGIGVSVFVDAAFANEEFGRAAATRELALKRTVSLKSSQPKSKGGNMSKSRTGSKGVSMVMSMFQSHKSRKGKMTTSKFSMSDEYL